MAVLHGGAGTRAVTAGLLLPARAARRPRRREPAHGSPWPSRRASPLSCRQRARSSGRDRPPNANMPDLGPAAGESTAERPGQPQGRGPLSDRGARLQGMTALDRFSAPTRAWFEAAFAEPTPAQAGAWEAIAAGRNALVVAPTGSRQDAVGVPLGDRPAARRSRAPRATRRRRTRVLYVSPLKALGGRRRAQPARPADRHPADRRAARRHACPTSRVGHAVGRHRPADRAPHARHARRPTS